MSDVYINDEKLKIGIFDGGGFGDALISIVLVNRIRSYVEKRGDIDFYSHYPDFFGGFSSIDHTFQYDEARNEELLKKYDLAIRIADFVIIKKLNSERVKRTSDKLYQYSKIAMENDAVLFSNQFSAYRYTKLSKIYNKHRIEHTDLYGVLGINKGDEINIPKVYDDEIILGKFGLYDSKYVVVNRDNGYSNDLHPKLWPMQNYQLLLKEIKHRMPSLKIVLIGDRSIDELIKYADLNLCGKTNLSDVGIILRGAKLLISSEGGLVHYMHFLKGRSMVFFGPTDPMVFGYDENLNLCANKCGDYCAWLTNNWMNGCLRKHKVCLNMVTPEIAINRIADQYETIMN